MINLKKLLMYIFVFTLLFQASIQRIISFGLIDYLDEIVIILFTLLAFIKVLQKKSVNRGTAVLFILMFLFFIAGSVSLFINSSVIFSRYVASSFLAIKCFLLIIDVSIIGFSDDTKEMFISVINNIGILCMIIGLFNFIFPSLYSKIFTFAIVTRRFGFISVTSLFYHTGRFGWFMLFLALMNYVIYINNHSLKNKRLFILFGLFSFLSFRTKVISSIIVILLINNIVNKKISMNKIIVSLLVASLVFVLFNDVISYTYDTYINDDVEFVSARGSLMDNSYKIMKDYFPLGVGFGKYGSWYARIYYSEYYYKYHMNNIYGLSPNGAIFATDTFWSAIFGETGVIGSTFYILFIYYLYRLLKKNIKVDGSLKSMVIYFSLFVLIQSIVESFGEPSFNSPPQYVFLALVVGTGINECLKSDVL